MADIESIVEEPLITSSGVSSQTQSVEQGIGLCLSGGGFRATLFHVGSIWRLNELGLLSQIARIASVSGGSITAGALAVGWKHLQWDENRTKATPASLQQHFIDPLRSLCRTTIDLPAIGWGIFSPFDTIGEQIAAAYDKSLFHGASLQDLPDDWSESSSPNRGPRFVIVATNVKTGSLFRFSKPYMADYRLGLVPRPRISLALAVAASSAFPPFLSPIKMDLSDLVFKDGIPATPVEASLRREAVLTDGGVYDNLGLEPIWKRYQTVLVSDAGRRMVTEEAPATDWARHSRRLIDLLQSQISSLRRKQVIQSYQDKDREGCYWGVQTDIDSYGAPAALNCPHEKTMQIAAIETRLAELSDRDQERLINWGYAVCDAAIRRRMPDFQSAPPPAGFPYPQTALG